MSTVINQTFAANLSLARKFSGMSLQELADKTNLSKQAISKYENGEINPSMATLSSLAKGLEIDIEDFFKENHDEALFLKKLIIKTPAFQNVYYREGGKLDVETANRIKKEAFKRFISYSELEALVKVKTKFKNPIKDFPIKDKYDAEEAALKVRKAWKLGSYPISNVVSTLENQGVRIIEVNEGDHFEGFSAEIESTPIIVVNIGIKEVTRRRFTTLHELGHLILQVHQSISYDDLERICDAFAATMLMPRELLFIELGGNRSKLTKDDLVRIKEKYGISVKAILVGAAFSEIITWDKYHELNSQMTITSDLGTYLGSEKSSRFIQLLIMGIVEEIISQNKAIELSGLPEEAVKNILEGVL